MIAWKVSLGPGQRRRSLAAEFFGSITRLSARNLPTGWAHLYSLFELNRFFFGRPRMDRDDYLLDEAKKYGKLADEADDPLIRQELLQLADICEKVAINIEDRMTAG
jgi:hypothetical protein